MFVYLKCVLEFSQSYSCDILISSLLYKFWSISVAERSKARVCVAGANVSVVCCQAEVSATSRSFVQRGSTDSGVSVCVIWKPQERGGPGPHWAVLHQSKENPQLVKEFSMFYGNRRLLTAFRHQISFG